MDDFDAALRAAQDNKAARDYPSVTDARCMRNVLFPNFTPKFDLAFDHSLRVFTIGSCFARNIEESLAPLGVVLPTMAFRAPNTEWPFRPNGLLNEYTPGTIGQRILAALEGRRDPVETIVPTAAGHADLLLPGGRDVTFERAIERREEIFGIYAHLADSPLVVITLGYVEAWFDKDTNRYLNRMPPVPFGTKHKGRFELRTMGIDDSMAELTPAIDALSARGSKVVLTVSPVPIATTFKRADCVVANEYSKSVLRVCADLLSRDRPNIDYFPSYEIVRSGGLRSYIDDNIHARTDLVEDIVRYMVASYSGTPFAFSQRHRREKWAQQRLFEWRIRLQHWERQADRARQALKRSFAKS